MASQKGRNGSYFDEAKRDNQKKGSSGQGHGNYSSKSNINQKNKQKSQTRSEQQKYYIVLALQKKKTKQKAEEVALILKNWIRATSIEKGWINDFNKIVVNYANYFQLLKILRGHIMGVRSVRFSADGYKVVSTSYDNTILMWDLVSRKQTQIFNGSTAGVWAARFSPDGHMIVFAVKAILFDYMM
ncbi:Serine/threonine protein kinase-related protein [Reticulomyxa filosa]|uniref:Serine/threonine protein kinase-related protein n=1 Tax=Reticulomyxa filosa TaxID=46433 RepID=X6NA75_RETFI|nr:Serine/threonine protein kinase-related protein [Reticulomyxa filosa]|eukprot:ETO22217.1 Serine/threonine protein kinase-related protein [Reticulomyxa filosa]